MTIGKTLRLRRIFAGGRAMIAGSEMLAEDPVQKLRLLARIGVDAAVLTPGRLDVTLEELGPVSVILRIDGGAWPAQLLGVEAALVMGADAVLANWGLGPEAFARVSEEARRCGMPLIVQVGSLDWLEEAHVAADYGADVILTRSVAASSDYHQFARSTGKPCLASLEEPLDPFDLLQLVAGALEAGAQGILLDHPALLVAPLVGALHALVHQGVSVEEAEAQFAQGYTPR
jgi:DhnA family fructose-bisphosphate aldolase class Ia